jgi:DNA modification methylase
LPIEQVAIADLKPHPANARTHSKKQIRQIAASIERFGFNGVVVVNGSNVIIAGHGRVEAAKLLGLVTVPCSRVSHLTPEEERAYVLADNKLALNSGWDRGQLSVELEELSMVLPSLDAPLDVSITGFEAGEIDALLGDHVDNDADPMDEAAFGIDDQAPVTHSGDLWHLGKHGLVCGDARDPAVYARLMAGRQADMVASDPPYNVPVQGHVGGRGKVRHGEFAFASGEMSDAEYRRFLIASLGGMADVCRPGALLYSFIDWRHVQIVLEVGRALDLSLRNICVWSKTAPGQGSFYRSAHELVCVFQKPGAQALNNIAQGRFGRSRTNVWTFAPPNKFKGTDDPLSGHPTPKPVAMIAEAIKDASARGDIVLDGFLGSGTTILAAEKVGRIGLGVEFEPIYCDLSIRRWQHYTGRDAILEETGQTFDEVRAARSSADGTRSVGSSPAGSPLSRRRAN